MTGRSILLLGLALTSGLCPWQVLAEYVLPTLTDITEQSGITFSHSFGDDKLSNIVESAGVGVALSDYDNDGLLDIYFVNGAYNKNVNHPRGRENIGQLTNKLYRNMGDNTFVDVTGAAGVGHSGYGMAALFGDLDNDGDQDLYVTNYGANVLFRNNGDGTFTDITEEAGVDCPLWSLGVTFLDFDNDGWLDIYVGNYLDYDPAYQNFYPGDGFPGPLSYSGQPDVLYHNNGDGTFTDVTRKAGLYMPQGRAMGVSATDLDNDGNVDIFVANDAMENYLFHNNGDSTFTNIGLESGTGFGQNGEATSAMSPEFGDFNNDSLLDILIPDMNYSSLFIAQKDGFFLERSSRSGLAALCGQYTSWSGNFFDFDADGWLDILITNGDSHFYEPEEDLMLLNRGDGTIEDISPKLGADFQQKHLGRGSAVGDLDNDGDLDIVITNINDRPVIYRTDSPSSIKWLRIRLIGSTSNRDCTGARVVIKHGGTQQLRTVLSSSGYLSQSDHSLHFGLGSHDRVETITITWPDQRQSVFYDVEPNQQLTFRQPN